MLWNDIKCQGAVKADQGKRKKKAFAGILEIRQRQFWRSGREQNHLHSHKSPIT